MQTAVLYIRVSTDEQADKGFSLRHQEEALRDYCEKKQIQVLKVFKDDYSAKTFNRPEFKKFLVSIRKAQERPNLLLFTKWDRFSRNTRNSYEMISRLKTYNIEAIAVDQPLDLSIPESLTMLAIFLTLPEVDNIRRGLNVSEGLRKGKKEGRWMGKAPKGYRNFINSKGEKRIEPNDDAPAVRWAFEQLAKGIYSVAEILLLCQSKGLKVSKSNFHRLLRNPVYCGYIGILASKKEPIPLLAKGIHEPLVTSEIFEKVQNLISKRKKVEPYKMCVKPELPLRGYINCPTCGKKLTGSASRSASGNRHFYYHCMKGCPVRIHAAVINDQFLVKLKEITFIEEVEILYQSIISNIFAEGELDKKENREKSNNDLTFMKSRLDKARNLLLDGTFSQKEFTELKSEITLKIQNLETELADEKLFVSDMKNYLKKGLMLVKDIDKVYNEADVILKQRIIRSIFKENLTFENNEVRTGKLNTVIPLIRSTINGFEGYKIKTEKNFSSLSRQG